MSFCSGTFSVNESFYKYSVNQNDLIHDLPNDQTIQLQLSPDLKIGGADQMIQD